MIINHPTQLLIRRAVEEDRQRLNNLLHFELHVHRHLDWRTPLDWLGKQPFLVAEWGGSLVAALACPTELSAVAWIQLFAVSRLSTPVEAWELLWSEAMATLIQSGWSRAAAIPLESWFTELLLQNGFINTHDVLFLEWRYQGELPVPEYPLVNLRPMQIEDLENVHNVDEAAFRPIWRNSLDSLQVAYHQASSATVVEEEDVIIGYQISTSSHLGGHLARLAVHPDRQGRQIGYTLVYDLLHQFIRKGIFRVTVNTQMDNLPSLRLYDKMGFHQTGEYYPVYELKMI